jgi:hypothetical protein
MIGYDFFLNIYHDIGIFLFTMLLSLSFFGSMVSYLIIYLKKHKTH